ncbi:MAG: 30S ribosomal protein S6--L-glutamate ligase [Bacteroidetes bacterium]|nr:30S ribosomal protein S6--L-glutamate ligase [Bacteroidota bacterium]
MNIAILSRGPQLYSTLRLEEAGKKRGHHVQVIDHMRCSMIVDKKRPGIYYDNLPLRGIDAIIPRIGASVTNYGAAIIKQFEMMNIFSVVSSEALLNSRDKLRCLQKLVMQGIDMPRTVFPGFMQDVKQVIKMVKGPPVIIKLLESTHGMGVVLAETNTSAESTIEAFMQLRKRFVVQEFIKESNGSDIRAFVVAGKVAGAMQRMAEKGEFRSNLHRGATAEIVQLTKQEEMLALQVVQLMGLSVAGVDILRSHRGPLIMEINASPGLEGIETITETNIAAEIIRFVEKASGKRHFAYSRKR